MFNGQGATPQRTNLLYELQHYYVITTVTAAMAKQYVCPAYNKGSKSGAQHRCDASYYASSAIARASRKMLGSL